MNNDEKDHILVSEQGHVYELAQQIENGPQFAGKFKFPDEALFISLLKLLGIDHKEFTKTYFYFENERKLHIAESEFEYVWISTYGLIAKDKATSNKAVNACANQFTVVSTLIDKAIDVSSTDDVYNVDSFNSGMLSELSPALFHNVLFYFEVFCKAYLSISGVEPPITHRLTVVYAKLVETMFNMKHNDSFFHLLIVDELSKVVQFVTTIPGDFREHFVKYDDNDQDNSLILFDTEGLNELKDMLARSEDFIIAYFYEGEESHYVKTGLYQRLLDKAENESGKEKIRKRYELLVSKVNSH